MLKIIKIIFFTLISNYAISQVPAGLPVVNSTGRAVYGYLQNDSAGIAAKRDTNWVAKYIGSWVYWQHAGVDSSFWVYNGNATGKKWDKVVVVSGSTSPGTGTVTTVSVTTANGVSGSVANPTTTPAITLTLGAITPTSVSASSAITASYFSGSGIPLTGVVKYSDTASMLSNLLRKTDTVAMLSPYAHFQSVVKYYDTSSMLTNRLKISDTTTMLSGYGRKGFFVQYIDSTNMLSGYQRKNFSLLLQDTSAAFSVRPLNNRFLDSISTIRALANTKYTGGTVTSIGVTSSDITVGNSPITSSGNITLALPSTGVVAGTYTSPNIAVTAKGIVTGITSVAGTTQYWSLSSTTLTPIVNSYNISTTGIGSFGGVTASGNISASTYTGSGSSLTGVVKYSDTSSMLSGYMRTGGIATANGVSGSSSGGQNNLITVTLGAITPSSVSSSGAITGTTIAGSIVTAAQPNITSLGTLSALTVTNSVRGANLYGTNIIVSGNSSLGALQAGTTTLGNTTITGTSPQLYIAKTGGGTNGFQTNSDGSIQFIGNSVNPLIVTAGGLVNYQALPAGASALSLFVGADNSAGTNTLVSRNPSQVRSDIAALGISDTSSMLSNLLRKTDTATMLSKLTLDRVLANGSSSGRAATINRLITNTTNNFGLYAYSDNSTSISASANGSGSQAIIFRSDASSSNTGGIGSNATYPIIFQDGLGTPTTLGAYTATGELLSTLGTAAQPNITTVGTLGALTVTNSIRGTTSYFSRGNVSGQLLVGGATASAINLEVLGSAGNFTSRITGSSTSGSSYGLYIAAGSTSGDISLLVRDKSGATDYFSVGGSGIVTIGQIGTGAVQATAGVLSVISDSKVKNKYGTFKGDITASFMKIPFSEYWSFNEKSGMPKTAQSVRQFGLLADSVHAVLGEEFAPTQPQSKQDSLDKKPVNYGLSDRAIQGATIQVLQLKIKADEQRFNNMQLQIDNLRYELDELKALIKRNNIK